ncbi:MAG: putative Holliday junction resolvase, partial [Litorivivens sp.]
MGKIMSIDYGLRRIGIAETDELQLIATGLTTVDNNLIWKFLEEHLKKNTVDCIVVGKPVGLDGLATDATLSTSNFVVKLKKKYPEIQVDELNEIFTSKLAKQAMLQGGMKKKDRRKKGMVDQIAATIILQDYMHRRDG